MSLHFLWRCIWRNGNGAFFQTHMIPLSKSLNQCRPLKQGKNSPFDSFLFLDRENKICKNQLMQLSKHKGDNALKPIGKLT